jgi:hypothetical protein
MWLFFFNVFKFICLLFFWDFDYNVFVHGSLMWICIFLSRCGKFWIIYLVKILSLPFQCSLELQCVYLLVSWYPTVFWSFFTCFIHFSLAPQSSLFQMTIFVFTDPFFCFIETNVKLSIEFFTLVTVFFSSRISLF